MAYLSLKQQKHIRAEKHKLLGHQYVEGVKWREQDQRIVEEKKNWMSVDHNHTDLNYRNYF